MNLIFYRGLVALALTGLTLLWLEPSLYPDASSVIRVTATLYFGLLLMQGLLHWRMHLAEASSLLLFQFASDVLGASLLVYATDGLASPFSFLLGLIVLASGTRGRVMMPVLVSLLACTGYLAAVYTHAAQQVLPLDAAAALHVLLQVSAILLVGGVMAFIARRHAGLRSAGDLALRQHRKLKGLHSRVMSAMSEGVIVLDGRLQPYEMNAAARYLLSSGQVSDALLVAQLLVDIPDLRQWFGEDRRQDFHAELRRGEHNLLLTAKAMDSSGGLPDDPSWLLTLVDISDMRRLEAKLIEQEKMAALGQMSAMLAHEIRNPIQTMAQGLELMKLDVEHRQTVQDILRDEMLRLNRLVNMMLDYSKPLEVSPESVEMAAVMEAAVQQADLENRSVHWHCEVDELWLDPDHFRLVLDNLLSNALKKRAPDSPVDVSLSAAASGWLLRVCNRGGLPGEVRGRLFQPYVSGSASGIGLGLSTVKQVCEVNGWTVDVDEDDDQVCFVVMGGARDAVEKERMHG
ncbi:MAG: HAMP domain-containing sensor histidine kinase [Mariprofundaceae bacterium]